MPHELSSDACTRFRPARADLLGRAMAPYELGQLELFAEDAERHIRREVERKLYATQLPSAGNRERRWVERLKKMARDHNWADSWRAAKAAEKWQELLASNPRHPGRYYIRHKLTPRGSKEEYKWYKDLLDMADDRRDWDRKWFAQMMLDGEPEGVSNFVIRCLFLLRDSSGTTHRLVQLENIVGEKSKGEEVGGSLILDAISFSGSEKFQGWALGKGNFNFTAGVTELQLLREDVCSDAAYQVVERVDSVGWFALPGKLPGEVEMQDGIWFFDECAYRDDRVYLPKRETGVLEIEGTNYYLAQKGREAEFKQGRPRLHPKLAISEVCQRIGLTDENKQWAADAGKELGAECGWMSGCFRELSQKCRETLGGPEAYLSLGAMFAFSAAPEIYAKYRLFPGLWIAGQMGSGKNNYTAWLMALKGYKIFEPIGLQKLATAVGMLEQAENYSNTPLWFDEYEETKVEDNQKAVIHCGFNRQSQTKWSPDGRQRVIKTAFIVSGETTATRAALRSRYPHVHVSATSREANHLEWFMENQKHFFVFERYLLQHRREFVQTVFKVLKSWMETKELNGLNERDKIVHGCAYAGWVALAAMLQSHDSDELKAFKIFLIGHARAAAGDVLTETNINVFFQDFINCWEAGEIPEDLIRIESEHVTSPPGRPNQAGGWFKYKIFLKLKAVLGRMQEWLVKQRGQVTLREKDIRDQIAKTAYYLKPPVGGWKKRFGAEGKTVTSPAIGIEMDLHPMGYQDVTDEEYRYSLEHPDDGDPRRGPLFAIIEDIQRKREKKARDEREATR